MASEHQNLWDFLSGVFETTNEKITAAISGAAIISPVFNLKDTSETAALWLPILGCVWLASQIIIKWWAHLSRPPRQD